jgi:CBS domain-containing protein
MHARDVMVAPVITVKPSTTVKEVAELFLENPISAAPGCQQSGKTRRHCQRRRPPAPR